MMAVTISSVCLVLISCPISAHFDLFDVIPLFSHCTCIRWQCRCAIFRLKIKITCKNTQTHMLCIRTKSNEWTDWILNPVTTMNETKQKKRTTTKSPIRTKRNKTKQNTEQAEDSNWQRTGERKRARRIFMPLLQIFDDKMTIACT